MQFATALCLGGSLAACAGDPAPDACAVEVPKTCPADAPRYNDQVQALIASRCLPCHVPGGLADARHDFTSYERVAQHRSAMLTQLSACLMPPANGAPLEPHERQVLLQWLVCDAPNN
ncbi:MAG TPA: hypothetical protein VFH51_17175 [Myxococcota bacterium]|nr:hypothetical protein [Myxococcota bacterium]